MVFALIFSTQDPASMNIKDWLLERGVENDKRFFLHTLETSLVHSDNELKDLQADAFIFCSKHQSAAGITSLAMHFTGNWNQADFGGEPSSLSMAAPSLAKNMFLELKKHAKDLQVTLESTHHGPTLPTPSVFIEIGSNESMWKNPEAGNIIAKTILATDYNKKFKAALALGSTHYPPTFNRIMAETDLALAHICPKHQLQFLTEEMLKKALKSSQDKIDLAVLDWKGMGSEKERVLQLLEKHKLPWKKSSSIVGNSESSE